MGENNNTAVTFTTNSSEALKFNPTQSTSTDSNMESGYVANKAIWWNVDGESKRINTNGISGNSKTIFQNTGEGCWTCLFTYRVSISSGYNGYIGANKTIGETEWKTQSNWVHTDTWNDYGPGCTYSNMWAPIYLKDITSGTVPALEGWNFRMTADHSTYTIGSVKKIQGGNGKNCYLTLKNTSVVTMNFGNGQQNPFTVNLNEGTGNNLNFVLSSTNYGSTITVNYGSVTKNTNRVFNASASSAKTITTLVLNATLTDPTEKNVVESIPLATFTSVSATTITPNISGTDGWTLVDSKAALGTQTTDGKYYYVENGTSTGFTLHTYQRFTTYNVATGATEKLSDITSPSYTTYSRFNVPLGSTLIVDVDDFDLTKITGEGNVTLDADATISGSKSTVATGKLTINEGKTLTLGTHQNQTNSIESFSSIELSGTIVHNNSLATLNNLTVPTGKTGKIFAYDMGSTSDGFKLAGTTTLNGNLTVCNKYNFQMKVDNLAGSGTWLICGTDDDAFNAEETASIEKAIINVAAATTFTGTINLNNVPTDEHPGTNTSQVTVQGNLVGCTLKKTTGDYFYYSGANLNGTTLDGVILGGSARINTSGTTNIKNLAGNNLNNTSYNYAFVGSGTINFYGTCDLTKKSDGTDCNSSQVGYPSTASVVINEGANVTTKRIYYSSGNNAAITNNGTITAEQLYGLVTLGEGSTTTLSDATPFNDGGVTVSGDATLNLTAKTTATLTQNITVASGKTLTIDGGESLARVSLTGTVTGDVNIKNATIEGGSTRDFSSLPYADYDNCTLVVSETTAEFNTADETITIINIPSYFTTVKLRRADRRYVTLDVTDGSATFTDSEAKVSGPKCLYDFTFSLETLAERKAENSSWILNSGSCGSSNGLQYDTNYSSSNSYNETTGLLKVKSTPWRDMSGGNAWPTDYSVAVYANVPDVENGCLMAFGSSTHGGNKYLALVRGASSNEIKLVKGNGMNNAFELIATMSAENATVAKHLVVFTKSGSTFKVYCDGVNVATTTYSETLGTGFQIGSVHGGVTGTGIIRINDPDKVTAAARDAAEVQAIRIFDGVLDDDQMSALMAEFPYVSKGGAYSRTILADANLGVDGAWTHGETTAHIPTSVVEDAATYYPDVTITTSADATLTVNEDATFGKTSFGGSGTLTIDTDASGHSINVVGAVIVNSDVIVKYGAIDMSTSPVTKGSDATLTFDFADYDFSGTTQTAITEIPVTGNADDYGNKVTAVYPSSDTYDFSFAYNSENHWYELTVTPKLIAKKQEALDMVTPYYNGNYVGTGVGKYTISLGETSYANMADFGNAVMAWTTKDDYVEPSITINPVPEGFYRFHIDDKYMCNVAVENVRTATTTDDDASTVFYLNADHYLIAFADGYGFNYSYCKAVSPGIFNAFNFTKSPTIGAYAIQASQGTGAADGSSRYITINNTSLAEGQGAWTIEAVDVLPVTISAAGYATFNSPIAVRIPDGVIAFQAKINGEKNAINLVSIDDGVIPANFPVVLKGDADSYNFNITTTELTGADYHSNALQGTVAAITVSSPIYTLQRNSGGTGVGFYEKTSGTLKGFSAYLTDTSGLRGFTFNEVTGIANTMLENATIENAYDLQGRRAGQVKKGVYILNGKKVLF